MHHSPDQNQEEKKKCTELMNEHCCIDMPTWACIQWDCAYFYKAVMEEKANGGRTGDWFFFEPLAGDRPNELLQLRA
jgi:hypothetical protein